jgi:hypothetical protein
MNACLAELCPYWPGEGCLRGVMPCPEPLPEKWADETHDERCCMTGAWPGWPPHPDCPGVEALEAERAIRSLP